MQEVEKKKPENFLVWAILTTVACCLPTGIVAIVYANKVDPLWYAGKQDEAEVAAKNARLWTFISLGVGILGGFIAFFFGLLSAIMG